MNVQNEHIMKACIRKWQSENVRNISDRITSTGQCPISDENCDLNRKSIHLKQMEQSAIEFGSCIIRALL